MHQKALFELPTGPTNGHTTNRFTDGVFGWYQYIQDFTGQFALYWLNRLARQGDVIWEPFSGSGTTLVASKMLGFESHGYDISPFMVDVAKAKVDWTAGPDEIEKGLEKVLATIPRTWEPSIPNTTRWQEYKATFGNVPTVYPNDPKLWKWMAPTVARRFSRLIGAINSIDDYRIRLFLRLAAASVLVPASNMVFRPNISYQSKPYLDFPVVNAFEKRARVMVRDYSAVYGMQSRTQSRIHMGDARYEGPVTADLIFTSPPYPNDMEYVHQTRLELALLNYVQELRDLTDLKKRMISSSVKLVYRSNDWQKSHGLKIAEVREVSKAIAATLEGKNWGWNAADMVAHYFGGMRRVLANWIQRLNPGGRAAIVIGDSAFNGVKVPTDRLLIECARAAGFLVEDTETLRRRWNNKHGIELQESVILLRK